MSEEQLRQEMLSFHFEDSLSVSAIQQFVKVMKGIAYSAFALSNKKWLNLTWPKELDRCRKIITVGRLLHLKPLMYVSTPEFQELEYTTENNRSILRIEANLWLAQMQDTLNRLHNGEFKGKSGEIADNLTVSFTLLSIKTRWDGCLMYRP